MKHSVVYDIATGVIRRHGSCMPADVCRVDVAQTPPALTAIARP